MASASAGSGENSNSSGGGGGGWYPQVVQPKRNGYEEKKATSIEPDFEQEISMTSVVGSGATGDHRFCRLCLSKQQQLKPLFPPSGTPDETLLGRILSCLTIALTFEDDYDTFICRICIQEVSKFFVYKEQCLANDAILRGRLKPSKINFNASGDQATIKTQDKYDDDEEEEEPDYEPIDSDEFDIPDEEDNSEQSQEFNESPSAVPRTGLAMEPWKLKPLPKQRARRENVQDYYYGGYRYTCATSRANGKVHWRCMYKSKLKCRAAILVSPNGTINTGFHRHNHQPDKKKAVPNDADGTIIDVHTGRKVTYKMIKSHRSPIHPTQMICNGYKYRYARSTQKQTTYWRCMKHNGKENCKAILSFRMDFSACSSNGHPHNHPAQYDMSKPLPDVLDDEPTKFTEEMVIPRNGNNVSAVGSSATPKVLKGHKKNVMVHKGYEYGFPRIDRQYSRWACFKKSLFNCPANLITNAGGRVIKESEWAHNHRANDDYAKETVIEGYMTDAKTSEQVYYKLIPGKRGQRFVLYKGYRYSSDRFMSDGRMAWKCTKCKVFIVIEGRFESFEDRGSEHEHPMMEEDDEGLDMGSCLQELPGMEGEQDPVEESSQDATGGEGELEFGVKNEMGEEFGEEGDEDEEDMDDDQDAFASDEDQLIIP
ncbi:uncharacterized protein LOC109408316 [Aedes albopictus]|uniref:ZAD domain-containing protein n=1 Tax=Aedes albopictus TaxID=7160 RepID=A0ABM1ZRS7_AEDAL|nr:uncharacterized protein LOC109408316 [Aedes albopictus]